MIGYILVTAWLHAVGMSSASQGRQAAEMVTNNDTGLWLVTGRFMWTGTLLVEDSVGPHLLTMDEPGNKTPTTTSLLLPISTLWTCVRRRIQRALAVDASLT